MRQFLIVLEEKKTNHARNLHREERNDEEKKNSKIPKLIAFQVILSQNKTRLKQMQR